MKKKAIWEILSPKIYYTNLLLTMKIATILIFGLTLQVSAVVHSQEAKLKLVSKQNTMADVIDVIENQTDYKIFYKTGQFDTNVSVSISSTDQTVGSLLCEVFEGSNYTYKLLDKIIVIAPIEAIQQYTVTGLITDATTGEPLPGVNIIVEGTTTGVISDMNGKYSITLENANATLVFSFVGYISEKIAVQGKATIDLKLVSDIRKLDEVVVVGYGTMKKLDISGAIVSANSNVIREIPSTNAAAALQGRLPGIDMSSMSSRPGAVMQIRIRGERSVNADNNPLIVVDGIPFAGGSLNDIAPSDIKSIDILKDASSTAIYGSRGANGVILVTTFRGTNNAEPTITYNGYYGIKTVAKKYEVYNGAEFQALRAATVNTSYHNFLNSDEQISVANGTETDWQDLMYSNAMVTDHDFGISSGTKKGAYSFGGGYYNENAVLPGQEYKRYSIRATIDQEIGKYLKVGFSSQNAFAIIDGESDGSTAGVASGGLNNILSMSPLLSAYNDDGSIRQIVNTNPDTYYNPLLMKNENLWQERRKRFSTFNSLYGEIKFTDFLKYRLNVGINYFKETYGNYFGSGTPINNGGANNAAVQNKNNTVWTLENLLYFDKVFAEKHRVNVTAMFSAEQQEYNVSQMNASGVPADYLLYYNLSLATINKAINATDNVGTPLQQYYQRGLMSYMGRVQYAYDDRYMITATFRADGASVLAPGHKWHNYPAVSAGWNIHQESIVKNNVKFISQLKLRAGYGQTSNQAISPYATLGQCSQLPYNFGSNNVYGIYESTLPNPDLGWEYTENYNIGVDFGFFDGRITGYFDYYRQKTKDLLVQINLPVTSGVANPMWQNVGATTNKGCEFAISGQVIKPKEKGGFRWDLDFNIYMNRNILTSLNSGVSQVVGNGLFVGLPINVIYDYQKLGIIQENEAPYCTFSAGMIKVADLNGDGRITPELDRKVIGSFEPDFQGGFSTRFAFKNFDLSVVSFFKSGGMLVSTIHMPQSYLNTNNGRRNGIKVDYWTPEHPSGTYPQPGRQTSAEVNNFGNTLGFFDASFLKVRTITLGYTFGTKLLNTVGCKDARIYFTCQNPFTLFSPYMDAGGLDPEATGSGAQAASPGLIAGSGIQLRQLTIGANTPPTRNFIVGLSFKF